MACFKDQAATQAVTTWIIKFLQVHGLKVGPKLTSSSLFFASTLSPKPQVQNEVVAASRDLSIKEATPLPEASTSGVPTVDNGEVDGEGFCISDFPAAAESTTLAIDDTLKYCQGNLTDESYMSALVNAIADLKVWHFCYHFCAVADISLLGCLCKTQ